MAVEFDYNQDLGGDYVNVSVGGESIGAIVQNLESGKWEYTQYMPISDGVALALVALKMEELEREAER